MPRPSALLQTSPTTLRAPTPAAAPVSRIAPAQQQRAASPFTFTQPNTGTLTSVGQMSPMAAQPNTSLLRPPSTSNAPTPAPTPAPNAIPKDAQPAGKIFGLFDYAAPDTFIGQAQRNILRPNQPTDILKSAGGALMTLGGALGSLGQATEGAIGTLAADMPSIKLGDAFSPGIQLGPSFKQNVRAEADKLKQQTGGYVSPYLTNLRADKLNAPINAAGTSDADLAAYAVRFMAYSGGAGKDSAQLRAARRVLMGEDPTVAMRGMERPERDADLESWQNWQKKVDDYLGATERITQAEAGEAWDTGSATPGTTRDQFIQQRTAQQREAASRWITATGRIPNSDNPVMEMIGQIALDPLNLPGAEFGRIFNVGSKAEGAKAGARAITEYDGSAQAMDEVNKIMFGQSQRMGKVEGAIANAADRGSAIAKTADNIINNVRDLTAYTPATTAKIQSGTAFQQIGTLINDARTSDEALDIIRRYTINPQSLTDTFGRVPVSIQAEVARPVVVDAWAELKKLPSLKSPDFSPVEFMREAGPVLQDTANRLQNFDPDKLSTAQKFFQSAKAWMSEFYLRTPGYIIRNWVSDNTVKAMDGLRFYENYDNVLKDMDKFGVTTDRIMSGIGGIGEEIGPSSKLKNVPIIGPIQESLGKIAETAEKKRYTQAFHSALMDSWGANWKPQMSDATYAKFEQQGLGDVADDIEAAWASAKSGKEARTKMLDVLNAQHPADRFFVTPYLKRITDMPTAMQAEIETEVRAVAKRGGTIDEVDTYLDNLATKVRDDAAMKKSDVGPILSPRANTEGAWVQEVEEMQTQLGRELSRGVNQGQITPEQADEFLTTDVDLWRQQTSQLNTARSGLRDALKQIGFDDAPPAPRTAPTPIGPPAPLGPSDALRATPPAPLPVTAPVPTNKQTDALAAIQDAIASEMDSREAVRVQLDAARRDIMRQDRFEVNAWSSYRNMRNELWNSHIEDTVAKYGQAGQAIEAIAKGEADSLSRFGISSMDERAEQMLTRAREQMSKTGVEAFDKSLSTSRYAFDQAQFEAMRQAKTLLESEPGKAQDVFDVLYSAYNDADTAFQQAVGKQQRALMLKQSGKIGMPEYEKLVSQAWTEAWKKSTSRYADYAPAQMRGVELGPDAALKATVDKFVAGRSTDEALAEAQRNLSQAEGVAGQDAIQQATREARSGVTSEAGSVGKGTVTPEDAQRYLKPDGTPKTFSGVAWTEDLSKAGAVDRRMTELGFTDPEEFLSALQQQQRLGKNIRAGGSAATRRVEGELAGRDAEQWRNIANELESRQADDGIKAGIKAYDNAIAKGATPEQARAIADAAEEASKKAPTPRPDVVGAVPRSNTIYDAATPPPSAAEFAKGRTFQEAIADARRIIGETTQAGDTVADDVIKDAERLADAKPATKEDAAKFLDEEGNPRTYDGTPWNEKEETPKAVQRRMDELGYKNVDDYLDSLRTVGKTVGKVTDDAIEVAGKAASKVGRIARAVDAAMPVADDAMEQWARILAELEAMAARGGDEAGQVAGAVGAAGDAGRMDTLLSGQAYQGNAATSMTGQPLPTPQQRINPYDATPQQLIQMDDMARRYGYAQPPEMIDVVSANTKQTLAAIDSIKAGLRERWDTQIPKANISTMMPDLDSDMKRIVQELSETRAASVSAAKGRADFALLDYGVKRGFDAGLSAFAPYYYWGSRQGRNFAMRIADRPAILANYTKYKQGMERENEQRGYRKRFEGGWEIGPGGRGGPSLFVDPMMSLFPFSGIIQADTFDSDDGRSMLAEIYGAASMLGFRPATYIDLPVRYMNLLVTAQPGTPEYEQQIVNLGRGSVGNVIPQTGMVQGATAMMGIGGPGGIDIEGAIRGATGDTGAGKFESYIVARAVRDIAADANVAAMESGTQFDNKPYLLAQAIITSRQDQGWRDLLNSATSQQVAEELKVPNTDAAAALQIVREAANRAQQDKGARVLGSGLLGQRMQVMPTGERSYVEMQQAERGAGYDPATGYGSKADVDRIRQMFPALRVGQAQYGTLPGESAEMPLQLYQRAERDEMNAQFDTLKDEMIRMQPWDKAGPQKIEDMRRKALERIGGTSAQKADPNDWRSLVAQAQQMTGVTPPPGEGDTSGASQQAQYFARSIAGATPREAVAIRKEEVLSAMARTMPQVAQFTDAEGAINWDGYNQAVAQWNERVPQLARQDAGVRAVVARADADGYGQSVAQFAAGLTSNQVDSYRRRNDSPLEAMQRAYNELVYAPTWGKYREFKSQLDAATTAYSDAINKGDTRAASKAAVEYNKLKDQNKTAFDSIVGSVPAMNANDLMQLVEKRYPGQFTPDQLRQALSGMSMPSVTDVQRNRMTPEARAEADKRNREYAQNDIKYYEQRQRAAAKAAAKRQEQQTAVNQFNAYQQMMVGYYGQQTWDAYQQYQYADSITKGQIAAALGKVGGGKKGVNIITQMEAVEYNYLRANAELRKWWKKTNPDAGADKLGD